MVAYQNIQIKIWTLHIIFLGTFKTIIMHKRKTIFKTKRQALLRASNMPRGVLLCQAEQGGYTWFEFITLNDYEFDLNYTKPRKYKFIREVH